MGFNSGFKGLNPKKEHSSVAFENMALKRMVGSKKF